jgi:predicted RNA-binding Zn-ribbon protein involved in translation (DUF1610 family)
MPPPSVKKPSSKMSSLVRALARLPPGPLVQNHLECLNCSSEWLATYAYPPLKFQCPYCGRHAGVRCSPESAAILGGQPEVEEPDGLH